MLDIKKFHESTSKELDAIKNRVRNLIGGANWGYEGRYKEAVLKSVIRRFLPKKYTIGSGFVVKKEEVLETSSQIDLMIYDTSFPLLFSEGDFVITTPESIRGIIEIKTNLKNQNLKCIIEKSNRIGKFIFDGKKNKNKMLFNGIFAYEGFENIKEHPNSIENSISIPIIECLKNDQVATFYIVNHISLNQNFFLKYWNKPRRKFSLYDLEKLSFSYFISNLIYFVTEEYIEHESKLWFSIDKEYEKIYEYNLNNEMMGAKNKMNEKGDVHR